MLKTILLTLLCGSVLLSAATAHAAEPTTTTTTPRKRSSGSSTKSEKSEPVESTETQAPTKSPSTDVSDIIDNLDYPELQVVPRASERLRIEAKNEDETWFISHLPIQIAGAATLMTGILSKSQVREALSEGDKSNLSSISNLTTVVGAGWVVAGALVGMQRPYRSGLEQISRIKDKDERSLLLRERLAEESLERPARLMRPLIWASVLTNFSLSALTGAYLTDQGRVIAGVSAVLAFLPVMYEDRYIEIYDKHIEYKKKIYRPITSTALGLDPKSKSLVPMATLTWNF